VEAAAQQKPDFSQFTGVFSGTSTLVANSVTYSGPAKLGIHASKDGQTALMQFSGSIAQGGTSLPFSGAVLFALHKAAVQEILFNASGNNGSVFGTYKVSRKLVTYSGGASISGSAFTVTGSLRTAQNKHVQKISFSYILSASGGSYVWTGTFSRKLK
jgi:hypothetical protein